MKPENKIFTRSFLLSGFVFAGLMAIFNYFEGRGFSLFRFLFYFLFFGVTMGLITRNQYKKQIKAEKSKCDVEKTDSQNS